MKFKKFTMLALAALSMLSIAGCSSSNDTKEKTTAVITTKNDAKVDQKYQIYLLAQESGYTGTYEEWLESIKGDSISVIVSEGKLKWKYSKEAESSYRDLIDLSVLKGEDGKSSTVTIGENGNWFIDGTDTEIRARANDGKGISTIVKTNTEGLVDTYTITFTDGTTAIFNVTNGSEGSQGATGNGVRSISKGESEGLVDTYIITFTDGSTSTFAVTNGKNGVDGAAGNGISSIVKGETVGLVDSYIITFSNGTTFTYNVTNGSNGEAGAAGNGIARVAKTGSEGLVDTYTITFTDGSTSTFTITNGSEGSQGAAGNGIESVIKTSSEGLVDTYTITFTNGDTTTFTVSNGSEGSQGATGNGIATVAKTGSEGLVDTYTITFTDGTTTTFTVTNGADGEDATASSDIVEYTNNGLTRTSYTYNDDGSVEKIVCFYRDGQWINQSKYLTNYRTDAYADPSSPYESIEELEYKWIASEGEWKGVIGTGYEYIIDGRILKQTWTYEWSDSLNDWDYSIFHIHDYNAFGEEIRDYYYKETETGAYDKYGVEHFKNDRINAETIIYHTWEGNKGVYKSTGKTHSILYLGDKPYIDMTLYLESYNGYSFNVVSGVVRNFNEYGELEGEPMDFTGLSFSLSYSNSVTRNSVGYSFENQYLFDEVNNCLVPKSTRVTIEDIAYDYVIYQIQQSNYDMFNDSWNTTDIIESNFDDDGNITSQDRYRLLANATKVKLSYASYELNEAGLISVSYEYSEWNEENQEWTHLMKYENLRDDSNKYLGNIGYNYNFETSEWELKEKYEQTYNDDGEFVEAHFYNWDPEANEGAGDWVLVW